MSVELRILGPHWTQANRVRLYSNGTLIREEHLPTERDERLPRGVHWQASWELPRPRDDVHLVAIAMGPGISESLWKTAKPYQPTSPDWRSQIIGCSGAVWFDGDGDGRRTPARTYAERLFASANGDLAKLFTALEPYDAATVAQAAHLFRAAGGSLESDEFTRALTGAPPVVRTGFGSYLAAWRDTELAKGQP